MYFSVRFKNLQLIFCLIFLNFLLIGQNVSAQDNKDNKPELIQINSQKGKAPIIIIPGLIGSELINKNTNETVWFKLTQSKDDDVRLPISTDLTKCQDNLIAGDILRSVKYLKFLPETEVYEKLTDSLEQAGGYKEEKWDSPSETGYEDSYYVFPYDWRRDNVENARLLIKKIVALKAKLKRPDLKFNVIAHSMGGLIARYAARFGDADLPRGIGTIKPTWVGAKHFSKIFLIGTPNEGSLSALDSLINGFPLPAIKGIKIPFVHEISKFDVFTIPSGYQLLPHTGTARIYDENLKPLKIDLFNPLTWEKYGWAAYTDPKFAKEFSPQEQKVARQYFRIVLNRAKRFQQALDMEINAKPPVSMYIFGADCRKTLEGMIIYHDKKKNEWKTLFEPDSFTRSDGTKVTDKEVKDLLFTDGDGVVTKDSLLTLTLPSIKSQNNDYKMALFVNQVYFTCEAHNKLTGNVEVQNRIFQELIAK